LIRQNRCDKSTRRFDLKLRKLGYLQNGVCLLPKTDDHVRRLKVLENDVSGMGGESVILDRMTLLILGLVLLFLADLVLAFATDIVWVGIGVVLWGLHMGFTQGLPVRIS
jgi:hypothetical protein